MFVKEKKKNVHYETGDNFHEKSRKLLERVSKLIHICLRKSEIGLGFTLGSEETEDKGESYTYVKKILDFSPAKYDGRLQIGDRILKINDLDVGSMSQSDIVRLIRGLPTGELINITVSRTFLANDETEVLAVTQTPNYLVQTKFYTPNEVKMEIFHFIITITNDTEKISHCQASAGVLGISVECRATEITGAAPTVQDNIGLCNEAKIKYSKNVQKQFFVKTILKNGSAFQDGRLKISDEILAVQGIDVQNGETYILDPNHDIYGDIFHFDLAAVFQKNMKKLNKFSEFMDMFETNSENPLYALKSLIKEAGNMYSSISIVIRRAVPFPPDRRLVDNDLIHKTYKNSKKKMNELCRIENIFELNPDYRHNYGDMRTRDSRYKEEEFSEIHGRSHHERFIHHRHSANFDDESGLGRSLETFYVDEYEYDKSLMDGGSSASHREDLYSYFCKDDECDAGHNDNDVNVGDNGDRDDCGGVYGDGDESCGAGDVIDVDVDKCADDLE